MIRTRRMTAPLEIGPRNTKGSACSAPNGEINETARAARTATAWEARLRAIAYPGTASAGGQGRLRLEASRDDRPGTGAGWDEEDRMARPVVSRRGLAVLGGGRARRRRGRRARPGGGGGGPAGLPGQEPDPGHLVRDLDRGRPDEGDRRRRSGRPPEPVRALPGRLLDRQGPQALRQHQPPGPDRAGRQRRRRGAVRQRAGHRDPDPPDHHRRQRRSPGRGGIQTGGLLTLNHSTVTGNTAAFGGGILSANTLTLNGTTVSGNVPDDCLCS